MSILFRLRRTRGPAAESRLVRACLDLLHLRGVWAWRNNTGAATYLDAQGRRRLVRFGQAGAPDILGILPGGRLLAVECKVGRRPLTRAQQVWLAWLEQHGALAVCVRSVEELLNTLNTNASKP